MADRVMTRNLRTLALLPFAFVTGALYAIADAIDTHLADACNDPEEGQ